LKIEYVIPTGGAGFTTLCDETPNATGLSDAISSWQIKLAKRPQNQTTAASLGSGGAPYVQDQGNGLWDCSWACDRQHASADDALAFIQTHALALNTAGLNFDLRITVGVTVTLLSNTALVSITPDPHSDRSTKIKYAFTGGTYTLDE
jgi:hypothetical protein